MEEDLRIAREERRLLEEIVQQGDEHAIEVYADWLLERGSPRGEFVTLQLKKSRGLASAKDLERARKLFRDHWHGWLGTLAPSVDRRSLAFERGVLAACRLRDPNDEVARGAVSGNPVLITVSRLALGTFPTGPALAAADQIPGLRVLGLSMLALNQLIPIKRPLHVTELLRDPTTRVESTLMTSAWIELVGQLGDVGPLESLDLGRVREVDLPAIEASLEAVDPARHAELRARVTGSERSAAVWLDRARAHASRAVEVRWGNSRAVLRRDPMLGFTRLYLFVERPLDAAHLLEAIEPGVVSEVVVTRARVNPILPGSFERLAAARARFPAATFELPQGWERDSGPEPGEPITTEPQAERDESERETGEHEVFEAETGEHEASGSEDGTGPEGDG